jgi:phosphoribosylformylglycinamidine synthase
MAMAGRRGALIHALPDGIPAHGALFGEDQARYLVTVPLLDLEPLLAAAASAGIPAMRLGVTGGETLTLPGADPISLANLRSAHEDWMPQYMAGERLAAE